MTENEAIKVIKRLIGVSPSERIVRAVNTAELALKEIQQYRAIGTVEECREARERQMAKKPILDTIYHQQYYCPNCEDFLARKNGNKPHHCICGQAIDWSDLE